MMPLTDRQREVYDFIVERIVNTGMSPTIREICNHIGVSSTNAVNDHLKALERKGWLTRGDGSSRSLQPVSAHRCKSCGRPMYPDAA